MKRIKLIFLQKNKPNKFGVTSIQMRVTFGSEQYYFTIPKELIFKRGATAEIVRTHITPEQFDRVTDNTSKKRLDADDRLLRDFLAEYQKKALAVAESRVPFDKAQFLQDFFSQAQEDVTKTDVFSAFQIYCDDLRAENRHKTAKAYWTAKLSIEAFTKRDLAGHKERRTNRKKKRIDGELTFEQVTPNFLKRYERAMLEQGNSKSTIGMHLRALRAVYRKYFGTEATTDVYPFGANKYQIPTGQANKRALSAPDLKLLLNYEPQNAQEAFSLGLWKTSYYCGGLNIADVIRLTPKAFRLSSDGYMTTDIVRQKTKRTRTDTPIQILLTADRWTFVSGFLEENADRFKMILAARGDDFLSKYEFLLADANKYLARICTALGIAPITTYHARHSAATTLLRGGVPIAYISEMLGHKSILTTQTYLGSFQTEQKKEFMKMLDIE